MAHRVPPPNPDENRLSQAKKLEEAQRIKEISAVDPDEQARKQQLFQQMMAEPEDEEEEAAETTAQPQPSPFQTSFHLSESRETAPSNFDLDEIPSPSYSPPPDLTDLPPSSEDELSDQALPQSNDFWQQTDLPDQPLDQKPQLIPKKQFGHPEEEKAAPGKQAAKKGAALPQKGATKLPEGKVKPEEKKLEPSPFGVPGKPIPKKGTAPEKEPPPFVKKKGEGAQIPTKDLKQQATPRVESEKEKEVEKASFGAKTQAAHPSKKPAEKIPEGQEEFSPFFQRVQEKREREGGGGDGKNREGKRGVVEITAPSLPGLPPSVQPAAASAASSAASYLRAEILPLFYQMVGTILVMTNQGVSTTEILLNNPAFAGSKFFGASIEIIKYSTAPDSLNIRLSGSNEAVAAFNQNIPGLMASFQTGGFRFRIGRIDAVYAADKPVFRRKEEKEQDLGGEPNQEEK